MAKKLSGFQTKSIRTRFIVLILVVMLAGQTIGGIVFLVHLKTKLVENMNERMKRTAALLSGISVVPLLTDNYSMLDSFLEEAGRDSDITAVMILDKHGNVIRQEKKEDVHTDILAIEHKILADTENIGTVVIKFRAKSINDSLVKSLVLIPLYQLFVLISLAFVIIWVFNRYINTPINMLKKVLNRVSEGDLTGSVPRLQEDEIGSIAEGVRILLDSFKEAVSKLNKMSENAEKAIRQLNNTFANVIRVIEKQNRYSETASKAVNESAESHKMVITYTDSLLSLSNDNVSALLEMKANSEEIAVGTDNLNKNINNSYSTVTELAQSAKQVAVVTGDVSSAVTQSAATVEEMFASVKSVEETIRHAASLINNTTDVISKQGMHSVTNAMAGMKEIDSYIKALMEVVSRLDKRSKDIEKILAVIEDITEQTRLLSLNAQIIAAQVGEHGKSFSVVANEMKALSDKTAVSTQEIENIVGAIKTDIGDAVKASRATASTAEEGNRLVSNTKEVLLEIQKAAIKEAETSKIIENTAVEQTRSLEQVVMAIEQIKKLVFDVNRATEEQEKGTNYLLDNIATIKDAMEATRRATGEQAKSTGFITDNIEMADEKVRDIAQSSTVQQERNDKLKESMGDLMNVGFETINDVQQVSILITSLQSEVDDLRKLLVNFKITKEEKPSSPEQTDTGQQSQ